MQEAGSDFVWFMAYVFLGLLGICAVVAWVLALQRKKHKQERRAAAKAARAQFRAWRDGKPPPATPVPLEHKKIR